MPLGALLPVAEGTGTVCTLPILKLLELEQLLAILPGGSQAGAGSALLGNGGVMEACRRAGVRKRTKPADRREI